jgi:hypothetical protein
MSAFPRLARDAAELRALLPAELADGSCWVAWREQVRDGKATKVPTDPHTGQNASTTNPRTWGTLEQALAYHQRTNNSSGVGRVLSADGGLVGIDLDGSVDERGVVEPWARRILDRFPGAYVERSPSRRGLKMWFRGRFSGRKIDGYAGAGTAVEMYGSGRYFTVTGDVLGTAPHTLPDHQTALDALVADLAIVELARRGPAAEKFGRLWAGDASGHDGDESRADLALCGLLARHTTNHVQLDRLFRLSGLMREKWNRKDYRERTVAKALAGRAESSTPTNAQQEPWPELDAGAPSSGPNSKHLHPPVSEAWPSPPEKAAFQGLAGDWVRMLDAHTEADPVALLVQLLAAFGSAVGRGPFTKAEADRHYTNIFVALVGETAKARKGTSWGHTRRLTRAGRRAVGQGMHRDRALIG